MRTNIIKKNKKSLAKYIEIDLKKLLENGYKEVGIIEETKNGYKIKYNKIQASRKEEKEVSWENIGKLYIATLLVNEYGYPETQILAGLEVAIGNTKVRPDFILYKEDKNINGKYDAIICEIKLEENEKKQKKTIKNQLIAPSAVLNQNFNYEIKQILYINFVSIQGQQFQMLIKRYKYHNQVTPEEVVDSGLDTFIDYKKDWNWESEILVKGSDKDLVDIKSEQEFDGIFQKIHRLVASKTGGAQPQRAFRLFLNLLLTKIWDESKTKQGEEYGFQYKEGENVENFFNRVNSLYEAACRQWLKLRGNINEINVVDQTKRGLVKIPIEDLKEAVKTLQKYKIRGMDKNTIRLIGEGYEKILWKHFKQSKGAYFTHENIVRIISDGLEIPEDIYSSFRKKIQNPSTEKTHKKIIDPACGSGNFLVYIFKQCLNIDSSLSNPLLQNYDQVKNFAENTFFGIDIESDLVEIARVHMVVFGDGAGSIFEADALESREKIKEKTDNVIDFGQFDYVVSNPPFSIENPVDPSSKGFSFYKIEGVGENQSEIFFIERFYHLLKPGGYLGIILPESIFDEVSLKEFRLNLIRKFKPIAVISLPEHAFSPYANQITNIFIAQKREEENYNNDEEFLVSKINDIGYIRKKKLYQITNISQVESAIKLIKEFKNNKKISNSSLPFRVIKLKDILSHEEYRMDSKFWLRNLDGREFYEFFELLSPEVDEEENPLEEEENREDITEYTDDTDIVKLYKFIVETGDINDLGIIIPQNISEEGKFTLVNFSRIIKKIKAGGFEKLPAGVFVISPARVYQGKIAYISEKIAEKYLFSKAFIKLKPKKKGKIYYYYFLLKSLIPEFVSVSVIGKRGYSFLRPKDLKYVKISNQVLNNLSKNHRVLQKRFEKILEINEKIIALLF